MRYENMVPGIFLKRPNRFIAHVKIDGVEQICHVKNTGRCKELLTPGASVWCRDAGTQNRKTRYDLIAVQKGDILINMDSQAPNAAAKEWLQRGGLGQVENIKPEQFYGSSRFDFAFQRGDTPCLLEVKGVTLEDDGICAFPDAPTERGKRHLEELTQAVKEGYEAWVLFVIQMKPVKVLRPHDERDPAFGEALRKAAKAGVRVLAMDCHVTPSSMTLQDPVPVDLSDSKSGL